MKRAGRTLSGPHREVDARRHLPHDRCHAITHAYTTYHRVKTASMGNQPSAILDNIASGSNCAYTRRKRGARVSA